MGARSSTSSLPSSCPLHGASGFSRPSLMAPYSLVSMRVVFGSIPAGGDAREQATCCLAVRGGSGRPLRLGPSIEDIVLKKRIVELPLSVRFFDSMLLIIFISDRKM